MSGWKYANDEVMDLLTQLSGMNAVTGNKDQLNYLFELILARFCKIFDADYAYIEFPIPSNSFEINKIQKAHGISTEVCYSLKNLTKKIPQNLDLDTNFQYLYSIENIRDKSLVDVPYQLRIRNIISIPILGTDSDLGSINLYFTASIDPSSMDYSAIHILADLLASTYLNSHSHIKVAEDISARNEYFENTFEELYVLDDLFFVIETNKRARSFLGLGKGTAELNFTSIFGDQAEIDTFYSVMSTLTENIPSEEMIFSLNPPINPENKKSVSMISTKFISAKNEIRYIISTRPIREIQRRDPTSFVEAGGLMQKIQNFEKLFSVNHELAISSYQDEFFPASIAMCLNEITGPVFIGSSPIISSNDVMQQVIKLMVGFDSDTLINQGYSTGTTPWKFPEGDLHWIAFTIANPKARGGIETHALGIIVRRNLITTRTHLLQNLIGSLMGSMNDYISIIDDDDADFVTTQYHNNRNFSTISLINESLAYLRHIAIELLGTLSYNMK
ncbi:MAG: hypothetical protein INQ03_18035 [Candidatus Heimdallarchaeota archaeon]|nr:hypothetical protein [Candidatus Heimdallarchaeota archaeon]